MEPQLYFLSKILKFNILFFAQTRWKPRRWNFTATKRGSGSTSALLVATPHPATSGSPVTSARPGTAALWCWAMTSGMVTSYTIAWRPTTWRGRCTGGRARRWRGSFSTNSSSVCCMTSLYVEIFTLIFVNFKIFHLLEW